MMAERKVTVETASASKYRVTVEEGETKTIHDVLASRELVERYGRGAPAVVLGSGGVFVDRFTKIATANAQNSGTRLTTSPVTQMAKCEAISLMESAPSSMNHVSC